MFYLSIRTTEANMGMFVLMNRPKLLDSASSHDLGHMLLFCLLVYLLISLSCLFVCVSISFRSSSWNVMFKCYGYIP